MPTRFAAFAIALLLAGCSSTSSIITGSTRAAISPEEVRVYASPPAEYEEIAILDASSKNSWAVTDQGKMDTVVNRLKEEAAKIGANGVLIQSAGDQSGDSVYIPTGGNTGVISTTNHKQGRAIAIFVP